LLVSVRSAREAAAALAGGAALIDIKEPQLGSLGRAADEVIASVVQVVGGRRPVSAALGELADRISLPDLSGLSFIKWGLAGLGRDGAWHRRLDAVLTQVQTSRPACQVVAVAYADWQRAGAPSPEAVASYAQTSASGVFLLDTWRKDGSTLLDSLDVGQIDALARHCRGGGARVALAGSLGEKEIAVLTDVAPDWFAVRGAVCAGDRAGEVDVQRVRHLVEFVTGRLTVSRFES
jgi:uncharacterized protein (UPF0264 family)